MLQYSPYTLMNYLFVWKKYRPYKLRCGSIGSDKVKLEKEDIIVIFSLILAGGVGNRMGNVEKPKQFLEICGKPIIIYTLENFCENHKSEKIIVLCPKEWISYTEKLIKKYLFEYESYIVVLEGGSTRNETLMNGIEYIKKEYGMDSETIIITHDAARPFINDRIINENISETIKSGAATTAIPATDTILYCPDKKKVDKITDRSELFQCQTPQTFFAKQLYDMYNQLSDEEKEILTDASGILVKNGVKVALVQGETYNIKITYQSDLVVAETYLKMLGRV